MALNRLKLVYRDTPG